MRMQDLYRYIPVEELVPSTINHAHTTLADFLDDGVLPYGF